MDENPKPEQKRVIDFAQVTHTLFTLPHLIGLALIIFTWVAVAAGGWFLTHQYHILKQQVTTLSNQPKPMAVDNKMSIEPLLQRIHFLEDQITQLSMHVAQKTDVPPTISEGKVVPDALEAELAQLKNQLKEMQDVVVGLQKDHTVSAVLVAAINLRDAIGSGKPYTQELATLTTFAKEDDAIQGYIKTLQSFADQGLATPDALKTRFQEAVTLAIKASQKEEGNTGIEGWVKNQLAEVVQVRRVGGDVEGDTVEAIIARAENDVQHNQFSHAVKKLQTLQGKPLEAMRPWMDSTAAYLNAREAANGLYRLVIAYIYHPTGQNP